MKKQFFRIISAGLMAAMLSVPLAGCSTEPAPAGKAQRGIQARPRFGGRR